MKYKSKLIKASAILSYIQTVIYFVITACLFSVSNYWYILCLILALVSLYNGFVTYSVYENMESVKLPKKEQIKLLVTWILSIVSPISFILSGVAYFYSKEDETDKSVSSSLEEGNNKEEQVVEVINEPSSSKKKKRFYRSGRFITMCTSFGLIFASSFIAMCFETSGFSVKVKDFTLTKKMTEEYNEGKIHDKQYVLENDTSYSVTMYVPKIASEENPRPTVFVLPGFTRTKATMSQYCVELSRRGSVVFSIDPGAQGATTETSTAGANGIEYLVQYVYNNTEDFKFCDKTKFGAIGHSAGGGNCVTLAADFSYKATTEEKQGLTPAEVAKLEYDKSIIKSVFISGYIKESSANKYAALRCNAALSYAYYDEGAYRYQGDTSAFEVISLRFLNEVSGSEVTYDKVINDYDYGSMANGTYRIVHREMTNHCFEMYDRNSIANAITFFDRTLETESTLKNTNQIWFGKEFSNGIALASAFTFIISMVGTLMFIPFFKSMLKKKEDDKVYVFENRSKSSEVATTEVTSTEGESVSTTSTSSTSTTEVATSVSYITRSVATRATSSSKKKSIYARVSFWTATILTAFIACLDYIPLANLSIEIFPTGSSASVFTFVFPARMVNAILLWATVNGLIGLIIYFAFPLGENLYRLIVSKIKGTKAEYDWDKFNDLKITGNNKLHVFLNVLKTLLIGFGSFGIFYLLVQLNYWCFHQDFRFMLISAAPLNARMFVTALEYIPLIFIFYISNSIRVNSCIGREGWKEWKVLLIGALANSVGLMFILLINYFCYFNTGTPFYSNWGNDNEVWLYVNMVFPLVVMMFILPIFNRLMYKITGNVYTGAIMWCCIFIMMTISGSVSYIPM